MVWGIWFNIVIFLVQARAAGCGGSTNWTHGLTGGRSARRRRRGRRGGRKRMVGERFKQEAGYGAQVFALILVA